MFIRDKAGTLRGTKIDVRNITSTFENKLNFISFPKVNPTRAELDCLLQAAAEFDEYPESYEYIAFYYTGHGGMDDSGAFVELKQEDKFYIEHILSPFQLRVKNKCSKCLFFFDCCLRYCGTEQDFNPKKAQMHSKMSCCIFNIK